jgi:hypothetical protein
MTIMVSGKKEKTEIKFESRLQFECEGTDTV